MLIRKRAQVLGYVDAPSREVAEAAAASAFSLTMSSASGSWCRSGTERASASQL